VDGPLLIDPANLMVFATGSLSPSGFFRSLAPLANDPNTIGSTLYLQALELGSGLRLSNRATVTLE